MIGREGNVYSGEMVPLDRDLLGSNMEEGWVSDGIVRGILDKHKPITP